MVYSVGKAIRQLNKEIDNIYFLSGDDYFLQKFFITNLNKKFQTGYSPRYFNFEEDEDVKIKEGNDDNEENNKEAKEDDNNDNKIFFSKLQAQSDISFL